VGCWSDVLTCRPQPKAAHNPSLTPSTAGWARAYCSRQTLPIVSSNCSARCGRRLSSRAACSPPCLQRATPWQSCSALGQLVWPAGAWPGGLLAAQHPLHIVSQAFTAVRNDWPSSKTVDPPHIERGHMCTAALLTPSSTCASAAGLLSVGSSLSRLTCSAAPPQSLKLGGLLGGCGQ